MGIANQILAQRQFNEIVGRFNHPAIDVTIADSNTCSECLQMLLKEGFVVREGQLGTHIVALPTEQYKGFWFDC